jgi:glycosyltransferase involved in cell wall biosynthesis
MRLHILGVPHTASNKQWLACAFTQKIVKLCAMLKTRGHTVIHYGNEASEVVCTEHVTVTRESALGDPADFLKYDLGSAIYQQFTGGAIEEIASRKQPHDFLLCPFGAAHKAIADVHRDMIVVEPGIGYPGGHFARFKVFESYAMLHAYYGLKPVETAGLIDWYDVVIPNIFDPDDFKFSARKDDYFLCLGRVGSAKGTDIAIDVINAIGARLVVAGPGQLDKPHALVEHVGIVGPEDRKKLLTNAMALLAPSTFIEPFCGVAIEAMLSGTPVISSDFGALAENILHGVTGYRCRTFEHFTWAARNIDKINPLACRAFAEKNFTMERVAKMYDEYFWSLMNIFTGKGWYEQNPARRDLGWLDRYFPEGS